MQGPSWRDLCANARRDKKPPTVRMMMTQELHLLSTHGICDSKALELVCLTVRLPCCVFVPEWKRQVVAWAATCARACQSAKCF